jgi:AraC-like DNA-binding protein
MTAVPQLVLSEHSRGAPFFAHEREYPRTIGWYDRKDYYSIAIVSSGVGSLATQSPARPATRWSLASGEVVFLRPADTTQWRPRDSDGFAVTWVSFPTAGWHSFAKLTGLGTAWDRVSEPPRASLGRDDSRVVDAFGAAVERFHDSPTVFDLVAFWTAVVPKLLRETPPSMSVSTSPLWLADAVEAMRDEDNLRAGIGRFAELAHVSPGYLATTVRRHYGRTPVALVAELRLQLASHLLRTTPLGVAEIAHRCGFRDPTYFSTRFHREFGVSPRVYRSRVVSIREGSPTTWDFPART